MKPKTNGEAKRKCASWVDTFVANTEALEAPTLFRKWTAITILGAVLEQKVWLMTSSVLYPNIYAFLVGHPGTGKTRSIREGKKYLAEIPDFHFAPTSVTGASLVDALVEAKRSMVIPPDPPIEYNSMMITAEELTAFMHEYDNEMVGILSAFYDPDPYQQQRRGKDIKIKIKSPQISILSGTTPSNLLKFLPEFAWDQGFTSRVMLIFSDERIQGDDFDESKVKVKFSTDLVHDLGIINTVYGKFQVSADYRTAVNNWRKLGEPDVPRHPKLIHYNTRRKVHLYKLSMIAAIDRSNTLLLTREDFNRAMGWLLEAESQMPSIFREGATGADGRAMDEILHYVELADVRGHGIPEHKLVTFARERLPAHSVLRAIDVMEKSGMISVVGIDRTTGQRYWKAGNPDRVLLQENQSPSE